MKKNKLILGLGLATLFALVGCNSNPSTNTSSNGPTSVADQQQEILAAAMNQLSVPQEVTTDFNLTVSSVGGVKITWSSSNDAIKIDGNQALVTRSREADVDVVLTAVAKLNDVESEPRTFNVKVLKLEVEVPTDAITVKEAKEAQVGSEVKVVGVVSAFVGGVSNNSYSPNGFYLSDATETIYVFGYVTANQVERGDLICITATVAEYAGAIQLSYANLLNGAAIAKNQQVPAPDAYAIEGYTIDQVYNPASFAGAAGKTYIFDCYIITYQGTDKTTGNPYTNYEISTALSGGRYMNIYSSASNLQCPENAWLDEYVNAKQQVKLAFYMNSTNSAGTSYRGNVIYIY